MTKEQATTKKTEPTTKKTEPTTKRTEAKEEGATSSVNYEAIQQNRRTKILFWSFVSIMLLAVGLIIFLTLIKPPVPRFMLDGLTIDPVSKSNVLVNLSSTNPSSTTNIYYSKMSVGVQIEGVFLTDSFYFQSTLQTPHERTPWTAAFAINNSKYWNNRSSQNREGLVKHGDVVAHVKIIGKFGLLKNSLRFTCPILIDVNDPRAIVSKPCIDDNSSN